MWREGDDWVRRDYIRFELRLTIIWNICNGWGGWNKIIGGWGRRWGSYKLAPPVSFFTKTGTVWASLGSGPLLNLDMSMVLSMSSFRVPRSGMFPRCVGEDVGVGTGEVVGVGCWIGVPDCCCKLCWRFWRFCICRLCKLCIFWRPCSWKLGGSPCIIWGLFFVMSNWTFPSSML